MGLEKLVLEEYLAKLGGSELGRCRKKIEDENSTLQCFCGVVRLRLTAYRPSAEYVVHHGADRPPASKHALRTPGAVYSSPAVSICTRLSA